MILLSFSLSVESTASQDQGSRSIFDSVGKDDEIYLRVE